MGAEKSAPFSFPFRLGKLRIVLEYGGGINHYFSQASFGEGEADLLSAFDSAIR